MNTHKIACFERYQIQCENTNEKARNLYSQLDSIDPIFLFLTFNHINEVTLVL